LERGAGNAGFRVLGMSSANLHNEDGVSEEIVGIKRKKEKLKKERQK